MKSFPKLAIILLVVFLIFSTPNSGAAALKVVAEPGADSVHVEMVQKTVNAFNDILATDMGLTLERDVNIFVCPTRDSYRQVLQREFSQSFGKADRNSKVTGGFSRGLSNAVAVSFDLSNGASAGYRAYKTTAHELFHQLQYQLSGKNMGKSFYWLKEGTADLIGASVAARVGFQSLDKWKLDQVNTLRKAEKHVSPQDILITDIDHWTTLIEKKQYPYEMSDLMVFYLINQTKSNGNRAIADYYRLIGQGIGNDQAFERAFGISSLDMIVGFRIWFTEITSQAASVEIIAASDIPAESIDDFHQGADLSRQFFIDSWDKDIGNSMRFVLTMGKQAYANAMVKEFGISVAEAGERAKNSTWWYTGSTTVYQMDALTTKRQRIFSISNSLIKRFAHETAPQKNLEQLLWLVNGSPDAVTSLLVERSGAYTLEQYRNDWLASLGKAGMFPRLAELSTPQSWNEAKAKYGSEVVGRTAALAGMYLLEKHGAALFINWCKAVKETGNAELSFQQVFGMTTAQFYEEFSTYLAKTVKIAADPSKSTFGKLPHSF